jgi:hypothetical protein
MHDSTLNDVSQNVTEHMCSMQDVFIRSLAQDYGRWATDAAYREQRTLFAVESDERIRQMQGVVSGKS